jgi:mRNA-degrading endonuclease RelE of RelBE toxin-antitoxin system
MRSRMHWDCLSESRAGRALRGGLRGLYSLRVGAYWLLYQPTESDQAIRVAAIRHRSIAYGVDLR